MSRHFIVTGGAGFIGSHMVDYLLDKYPDASVCCLDKVSYASDHSLQNLHKAMDRKQFSFQQVDLATDPKLDEIIAKELQGAENATVFNFAAESCVDRSFCDPVFFTTNNILATQRLLEACLKVTKGVEKWGQNGDQNGGQNRGQNRGQNGHKNGHQNGDQNEGQGGLNQKYINTPDSPFPRNFHFIHISTDEVYGEQITGEVDESGALLPSNPYAASKAACDLLLHSYWRAYKAPVTILRANNVYGPRQHSEKIVSRVLKTIHEIRAYGEESGEVSRIPIHGTGAQKRRYLHVQDFVQAIDLVYEAHQYNDGKDDFEVYNVGSSDEVTNLELVSKMFQIYNSKQGKDLDKERLWRHVEYVQDRPFNDERYAIVYEKIQDLGWSQRVSLDTGLEALISVPE